MGTDRLRSAWSAVAIPMAVFVIVQASVADRYGFHRDELYFLEAGRHLALGYVDQPPLVPLLARVQSSVLGSSPWSLRVVPIVVGATIMLLAAALARELGGSRRAMTWAAAATGSASFVLTLGHLLSTATLDFAFWLALVVVAARLLRTGDPRLWVVYGAVAGTALWNKHLPVMLSLALVTGLALEGRWDLLRSRWLLLGGALAAVLIAPHLAWQAANGWPQIEMAATLSARVGGESRATLVPLQLLMLGPFLVPLAVVGVRWLVGAGRLFRPLLWAYGVALVLTFLSGGRPYYPLPLAASLVVAGAVALAARPAKRATHWVPIVVMLNLLVGLPLSLPVLPVGTLAETPIGEINDTLVEQIGWRRLAGQVAGVVRGLPADEGDGVVVLTGSYGEAGAIDRYAPALGLPPAHSGHNSYWYWRRPTNAEATVVAVRLPAAFLARQFRDCTQVGTVDNGHGIDNEAQGVPISVCRGLRGTWEERWPDFRHSS